MLHREFIIKTENSSKDNKYIQSATLNESRTINPGLAMKM